MAKLNIADIRKAGCGKVNFPAPRFLYTSQPDGEWKISRLAP